METVSHFFPEWIDSPARTGWPTKVSGLVLDFLDMRARKPLLKFPSLLCRPDRNENRSSVASCVDQQLNEKGYNVKLGAIPSIRIPLFPMVKLLV
jgi:hypothetical protein